MDPADAPRLEECDKQKIEAALAAPQAGFGDFDRYPSLPEKAAALLYAIAKGHACPNGNKRLACVLTVAFLVDNGAFLWADRIEFCDKIVEVAQSAALEHERVRADLSSWIEARIIEPAEASVRLQAGLEPGANP